MIHNIHCIETFMRLNLRIQSFNNNVNERPMTPIEKFNWINIRKMFGIRRQWVLTHLNYSCRLYHWWWEKYRIYITKQCMNTILDTHQWSNIIVTIYSFFSHKLLAIIVRKIYLTYKPCITHIQIFNVKNTIHFSQRYSNFDRLLIY